MSRRLSLNFPSALWGFARRVFSVMSEPDLGLECLRAYNDWMIEDWCGSYPDRFIACQLRWLADVDIAARTDVTAVVHQHPRWSTVWANVRRVPPIYDQTGAVAGDDLVLFEEYGGSVTEQQNSVAVTAALGAASMMLLADHGALVVGGSVQDVHLRAVTLESRCRQAWRVAALGGDVPPLAPGLVEHVRSEVAAGRRAPLWEMAIARELRLDPALAGSASMDATV